MRNSRQHLVAVIAGLLLLALANLNPAHARSAGPPDAHTGAFGELDCTNCHFGPTGTGSVSIQGLPASYALSTLYDFCVSITEPSTAQKRWGFELTCGDSTSTHKGTFTITDSTNTQLSASSPRQYVKQTSAGTFANTTGGHTWRIRWT